MHSSRMHTARCSGRLSCHTCPPTMHASNHACSSTHASYHAQPPLPCIPPTPPCMPPPHMSPTTNAPYHACPLSCTPPTMHAPLPCMHPTMHGPCHTHTPSHPQRPSPATHTFRLCTPSCEKITFANFVCGW